MFGLLGIARSISKGDILSYMFMPQVLPRIRGFYQSGFSQLAYIIALVYRSVRILPEDHRLFDRKYRKDLTLRGVLGAAASELKFDKKNIDKVLIYFLILAGLVLLAGQFVLMVGFMMFNPAFAGPASMPTNYGQFFATPRYQTDIAYMMLFSVFGVPDLFNVGGSLNQYHTALHALFQFYSIGLLVIAAIIIAYYIFAVLVETAQTGVPFGKRYNHVWTPIRLVVALGLLVPMGYGLNAAQWITLYAAKFGSDFATQGWVLFNQTMNQAYLNNPNERVGTPQMPEMTKVAAFMMTAKACKYAYEFYYAGPNAKQIDAYLVKTTATSPVRAFSSGPGVSSLFQRALNYYNRGNIIIRFGQYDAVAFKGEPGSVYPYCGEIMIQTADVTEPGSLQMMDDYFYLLANMWTGGSGYAPLTTYAQNIVDKYRTTKPNVPTAALPPPDFKSTIANQLRTDVEASIQNAVQLQATSPTWATNMTQIQDLGWGGAGIWYNKIAQINGSLVQAVNNAPSVVSMPAVMEYTKTRNLQQDVKVPNLYDLNLADGQKMQFDTQVEGEIASVLNIVYEYWSKEDSDQSQLGSQTKTTMNVFIDIINLVFGTRGLFNMCANTNTHPLAQLSILGKGLVEASIRNLGMGFGLMIGQVAPGFIGVAAGVGAQMLLSIASITLTMGFILFYVVPFLPFLYFFFAVGGWIKGLFEAMVGVPLWALAHLRIDGEGLPGDAAMDGYHLILEIFLRPILIVFGLLASVVIFAAMVKVLNEVFTLVVSNLSGHDEGFTQLCGRIGSGGPSGSAVQFFRGPIDEFFFTVMYAIIVYMIGMSCFKLIDLVPNNLLRYMGARIQTFNDVQNSPAEGLLSRLSIGGSVVSSKLVGIGQGGANTLVNTLKGVGEVANGK